MGTRYIQRNEPHPVQIGDEWFPPRGEPFFHKVWSGGSLGWTTGVFGARPADIDDPAVSDQDASTEENDDVGSDETTLSDSDGRQESDQGASQ